MAAPSVVLAVVGVPTSAQVATANALKSAGKVTEIDAWCIENAAGIGTIPAGIETLPVTVGKDLITEMFKFYSTSARSSKVFVLGVGVEPSAGDVADLMSASDPGPDGDRSGLAIVGASWGPVEKKWQILKPGQLASGPVQACIVSPRIVAFLSCRAPVTSAELWGHLTTTTSPKLSGYKVYGGGVLSVGGVPGGFMMSPPAPAAVLPGKEIHDPGQKWFGNEPDPAAPVAPAPVPSPGGYAASGQKDVQASTDLPVDVQVSPAETQLAPEKHVAQNVGAPSIPDAPAATAAVPEPIAVVGAGGFAKPLDSDKSVGSFGPIDTTVAPQTPLAKADEPQKSLNEPSGAQGPVVVAPVPGAFPLIGLTSSTVVAPAAPSTDVPIDTTLAPSVSTVAPAETAQNVGAPSIPSAAPAAAAPAPAAPAPIVVVDPSAPAAPAAPAAPSPIVVVDPSVSPAPDAPIAAPSTMPKTDDTGDARKVAPVDAAPAAPAAPAPKPSASKATVADPSKAPATVQTGALRVENMTKKIETPDSALPDPSQPDAAHLIAPAPDAAPQPERSTKESDPDGKTGPTAPTVSSSSRAKDSSETKTGPVAPSVSPAPAAAPAVVRDSKKTASAKKPYAASSPAAVVAADPIVVSVEDAPVPVDEASVSVSDASAFTEVSTAPNNSSRRGRARFSVTYEEETS